MEIFGVDIFPPENNRLLVWIWNNGIEKLGAYLINNIPVSLETINSGTRITFHIKDVYVQEEEILSKYIPSKYYYINKDNPLYNEDLLLLIDHEGFAYKTLISIDEFNTKLF